MGLICSKTSRERQINRRECFRDFHVVHLEKLSCDREALELIGDQVFMKLIVAYDSDVKPGPR